MQNCSKRSQVCEQMGAVFAACAPVLRFGLDVFQRECPSEMFKLLPKQHVLGQTGLPNLFHIHFFRRKKVEIPFSSVGISKGNPPPLGHQPVMHLPGWKSERSRYFSGRSQLLT